ncbi:glutathione S-transferase-like isoform X2 [Venturia canescens]|nr:glutathione S-transferase-like isoform X2 [Venturia canescens]
MPQYKLTYFDVMGLGEPIRLLLSYGGHEFEDMRVAREAWPAMKKLTPFGQLPLLQIDGETYGQTLPICRYLAKQLNLIGKTDVDALRIDAIANALHDMRKQVALFYREPDPLVSAKIKVETVGKIVPFFLDKFEELAKKNGGYLHGGELSYADIFFVGIHDSVVNACGPEIMSGRPSLQALRERVVALPNVKAWIDKRPKNDF